MSLGVIASRAVGHRCGQRVKEWVEYIAAREFSINSSVDEANETLPFWLRNGVARVRLSTYRHIVWTGGLIAIIRAV
jgi:hypothetical protein